MSMPAIPSATTTAAARPAVTRLLVPAFTATLFLSAFLLFGVQPMFTKMVLPKLGGSPAVWSVAMVFFQGVLLLGYAYAHWLVGRFGVAKGAGIHLAVMLVALLSMPIAVASGWTVPPQSGQAVWLLGAFAASVGLPFFAVSANGPLLQAWFSRSGHAQAADPYFLYAASNIGSLLALLSYPILVEPFFAVTMQSWLWAGGFGLLMVAIIGSAMLAQKGNGVDGFEAEAAPAPTEPIALERKFGWAALAFVPSALLVAVTAHLNTDVAAAPFLWVLPLALFLGTFVITFQSRPLIPHNVMLGLQPFFVVTSLIAFVLSYGLSWVAFMALDLAVLFVCAMVCHGELVRRRPDASGLTGFYLWMSLGGVLGGVFAGLIAPHVFSTILEYPLLLVASLFCRPGLLTGEVKAWRTAVLGIVITVVAVIAIIQISAVLMPENPLASLPSRLGQVALVAAFLLLHRAPRLLACIAAAFTLTILVPMLGAERGENHRGFFGVHKVQTVAEGSYRRLLHGTTIHGVQRLTMENGEARYNSEPLAYYYDGSPLNEAIETVRGTVGLRSAALVGLGSGALACQAEAGEIFKAFEIDPLVIAIASDTRNFGYLDACPLLGGIVVGDARLTLADEPKEAFDIIILDAFSSDSVPVHLLTVESMKLYMDRLANGGLVAFHVSNRNMKLAPVVGAAAKALGHDAYFRKKGISADDPLKYGSEVVVVGKPNGAVAAFAKNSAWKKISQFTQAEAWTDDYSNVIGAIWAKVGQSN